MAAPTNTTALTATDVGVDLPADIVQTVDDAGITYEVWYKYTAQVGDNVIGVWAFGDLSIYFPVITVYVGPATAPVAYLGVTASDVPVQIPVTVGTTYFFKIAPNAGNPAPAVLTLSVLAHADVGAPIGSIAINDDTTGFPLALASSADDDTVLTFIQGIAAGECGDVLVDGQLMLDDATTSMVVYDLNYAVVATTTLPATFVARNLRGNREDKFYLRTTDASSTYIKVFDRIGALLQTTSALPTNSVRGIAPNPDGTICYFGEFAAGRVGQWDMVNDVALADIITGLTANTQINDMLCMADGSIVIAQAGIGRLKIYNSAGVLQVTITAATLGVDFVNVDDRFCYDIDDDYFWYRNDNDGHSIKVFKIKASDGSIAVTRTIRCYEVGAYQGVATATPTRFGVSFSCPIWITRTGFAPPLTAVVDDIRRLRRFPLPFDRSLWVYISRIEFLIQSGMGLNAGEGQGSDPILTVQFSGDGGVTWGDRIELSAGQIGDYELRPVINRIGKLRNGVCEITISDPVYVYLLACFIDADESIGG